MSIATVLVKTAVAIAKLISSIATGFFNQLISPVAIANFDHMSKDGVPGHLGPQQLQQEVPLGVPGHLGPQQFQQGHPHGVPVHLGPH